MDLVAQNATLYSPPSYVETTTDGRTYRAYYQRFVLGDTTVTHGCLCRGAPVLPHRVFVVPRSPLPAGASVSVVDWTTTTLTVNVTGVAEVRLDVFAFSMHSIVEPPMDE